MASSAAHGRAPKPAQPFKDRIDAQSIGRLAAALRRVEPNFAADAFVRRASRGLGPLELKARISHVADALAATLPTEFAAAAASVDRMLDTLAGNADKNAGKNAACRGHRD